MASPKSIILFTFLLAALELARGTQPMCKTNEDCNEKMDCIEVEGETLICDTGRCTCINEALILAAAPRVQDITISMCEKDEDCDLVIKCIDAKVRCSHGNCRCINT